MNKQQLSGDERAVIEALVCDVVATIGLRDQIAFTNWLIGEALDALSRTAADYDLASFRNLVVDDFQQRMHDEFVDVSWPRCSRHPNHPMWLQDGSWWCTKDNVPIARLGKVPSAANRE